MEGYPCVPFLQVLRKFFGKPLQDCWQTVHSVRILLETISHRYLIYDQQN